jgi:hypothetical protein
VEEDRGDKLGDLSCRFWDTSMWGNRVDFNESKRNVADGCACNDTQLSKKLCIIDDLTYIYACVAVLFGRAIPSRFPCTCIYMYVLW